MQRRFKRRQQRRQHRRQGVATLEVLLVRMEYHPNLVLFLYIVNGIYGTLHEVTELCSDGAGLMFAKIDWRGYYSRRGLIADIQSINKPSVDPAAYLRLKTTRNKEAVV
ncbi:Guanylate kinase [Actinidia chinensis var. chinensis]|uniref:Guanylate kinase n=1 Tax=Actinidia chinensis var. chinensis TaxID=1590841 RepID=A0A2R6S086_ACTCC|nr:Guanylate kinase [Actinidia chinensis var. chinensis]